MNTPDNPSKPTLDRLPPAISDRKAVSTWLLALRNGQPPSTVPAFSDHIPTGTDPLAGPSWFLPIPAPSDMLEVPAPITFIDAWPYFPEPDAAGRVDGSTNFATVILAGTRGGIPTPSGQRIFGVLIRKRPMRPRGTLAGPVPLDPTNPRQRFALVAWDWKGGIWSGEMNTAKGGIYGNVSIKLRRRATDSRAQWFGPWFLRPAGMLQAKTGRHGIITRPDNDAV